MQEDSPEWRASYTSSTLVIMRFLSEFQGNYTCVASNAFRMKKQTFYLSESPLTIPEVTSQTRGRRGRGGRRSGRRRGRKRKNEIPGSETAPSGAESKTSLRQAIEQQQQEQRHQSARAETTTASGEERRPPWLPVPTGNEPSAAPPGDDDDNDDTQDDWEASGNEASDDEAN